jgi:hypothetical protein
LFNSMSRSWALINSSSMFRRLALCMAVVGIVSEVSTCTVEGLVVGARQLVRCVQQTLTAGLGLTSVYQQHWSTNWLKGYELGESTSCCPSYRVSRTCCCSTCSL